MEQELDQESLLEWVLDWDLLFERELETRSCCWSGWRLGVGVGVGVGGRSCCQSGSWGLGVILGVGF